MFDFSGSLMSFLSNFISLFLLSAPWLLFGFVMAAMIKALVNMDLMYKHLGGNSLLVTVKAAFIGAPLPLCSCGVVPAALGLRSAGASKNATISFLVATPETGVDSVSFTYALMGPVMAIVRPVAAITSAIVAGILVGKSEQLAEEYSKKEIKSCCESKPKDVEQKSCCDSKVEVVEEKSCCGENQVSSEDVEIQQTNNPMTIRMKEGFKFAFGKMLRDVINWLLIGLLVAAFVETFLPESFFEVLGDGFASMLLMAMIGVPMYVCATASTPVAAGFLLAGLSPGAVLVFMLVGPASNIGTLMIIKKELGVRAIIAYLLGIVLTAFSFGFMLNWFAGYYAWDFAYGAANNHAAPVSILSIVSALILAVFMLKALWQTNFSLTVS